ncbi:MAG: hypothetical protein IT320_21245 [Anaerolineae bacterium]|nr:hypothetical protein [Anaerolineae bacterium]
MTLRRMFITAACLCLLLIPTLADAQTDRPWYVVLYDHATGRLVRVDGSRGEAREYHLNINDPAQLSAQQIAVSPDAFRAAYCLIEQAPGAREGEATLYVRDLELDQVELVLPLGPALRCTASADAYDETGARLAVSITRHPDAAGDDTPGWRIAVVDSDGRIADELTARDPAVGAAGLAADLIVDPDVRAFLGDAVMFAALPYGVGGTPTVDGYRWQLAEDVVTPDKPWGAFALDALAATGELIYPDHDPTLPSGGSGASITPFNRVMLAEGAGSLRTIYQSPDWIVLSAQFVENGRALALEFLEPAEVAGENPPRTRWFTLTRDVNARDVGVFAAESGSQLSAAPDGFVLLWAEANGDDFSNASARLDYYVGDEVRNLWKEALPREAGAMTWELVWATPSVIADDLPPFFEYTPPGD